MLKWIETTGRSEEDAIAAALFQLGMDRDDVSVEVIELSLIHISEPTRH